MTSSQHAQPSGVLRRRSDGLECAAWQPPRPVAQCQQFQEDAKDASVSECTWTLSALEALRYINVRLTYLDLWVMWNSSVAVIMFVSLILASAWNMQQQGNWSKWRSLSTACDWRWCNSTGNTRLNSVITWSRRSLNCFMYVLNVRRFCDKLINMWLVIKVTN